MGEIVVGVINFVGRIIGHIFIELILELIVKGPGYLISQFFYKTIEELSEQASLFQNVLTSFPVIRK